MNRYAPKPNQRTTYTLLHYAAVLFLLLGCGIKQFSDTHDPSHYLQEDVHCSACLSSLNLSNGVNTPAPFISSLINTQHADITGEVEYRPILLSSSRNRGPPKIA